MNDNDLKLKFDLYVRRLSSSGWDRLLERTMDTMKAVGEAVERPGVVTVSRAALSVARALTSSDLYYAEVLDVRKWKPIFPNCIKNQLLEILEPHVTSKISVSTSGDAFTYLISGATSSPYRSSGAIPSGVRLAWVKDGNEERSTEILAHVDAYVASVEFARELLWKTVDPTRIVVTSASAKGNKRVRGSYPGDGQLRVVTDDLVAPASSEFATEYAPYLQNCLDQKVNRTILFYGPPGTGKSTISRTLCDTLKLRSLRVRVEDVADLGSEPIVEMIKIFGPDVVIFEDLDRSLSQVALLETLENLHKRVRFVFATVNHIESLQQALIRPGRFDEVIEIVKLDAAAVRLMLGDYGDAFELVKDWPVAFINEYVIRRRLVGPEKAKLALIDLQKRVERLMGKNEEQEDVDG